MPDCSLRIMSFAPASRLALLLVVPEGRHQPAQDLRRRLEHRLELRLVDLVDIAAKVVDHLGKLRAHLAGVVERIVRAAGGFAGLRALSAT